jgi:chromosomal replication initiation ATPase DnaA
MAWTPPRMPYRTVESRIDYWQSIAQIPDDETGAQMLREMAEQRLIELREELMGSTASESWHRLSA